MNCSEAKILVAEIKKLNPKLNDWEKTFIETIQDNRVISNKQAQCLMNIYGKAAGGGVYQRRQYI